MGKWFCITTALLLALPGCGADETPTRHNDLTPLTSIVIEAEVVTLAAGTSTQLIARGNYSGLFLRDITNEVTWRSNQTMVAGFSTPGRINALSPGLATITATLAGIPASIDLNVSSAVLTALAVESAIDPQLPLPQGLTRPYTAQGTFSDGSTQDVTFDVVWASSDPTVATVSNEAASKGEVAALKTGTTTITANFAAADVTGGTLLIVTDPVPLSLEVGSASTSLLSLSTQPFTATGRYSDGSSLDVTANVSWASSNTTVATMAADGTLKALTPGTATITATFEGLTATSIVKVTGGRLQSIALTPNQLEQVIGTLGRVTATGTFNNGTSRDITGAIESWTVSDGTKASITGNAGENLVWVQSLAVTPQANPVKITATYGNISSGEASLIVANPTLSGVALAASTLDLSAGTSGRLRLSGNFSPVSNQDLSPSAGWSSATPATATVGELGLDKGRIFARAEGTSVVTTTYEGHTATATVTVTARTLQSLTVIPVTSPSPLSVGTEQKFMVEALYTDGFRQDVTADATWSVDQPNILKFSDPVADPGLIVAVDTGTATLKATFNGLTESETLLVSP